MLLTLIEIVYVMSFTFQFDVVSLWQFSIKVLRINVQRASNRRMFPHLQQVFLHIVVNEINAKALFSIVEAFFSDVQRVCSFCQCLFCHASCFNQMPDFAHHVVDFMAQLCLPVVDINQAVAQMPPGFNLSAPRAILRLPRYTNSVKADALGAASYPVARSVVAQIVVHPFIGREPRVDAVP